MASSTFFDEQRRNKRDSILLAILVSIILFSLIITMAYIFAPGAMILTIPLSLLFVLVYTWSSFQYGDQVVLSSTNARPAEGPEFIYLNNVAEGLSLAAGIPPPKVYVVDSPEINAFATGKDPEHASIAVTTGALKQLNRQELEGIVAHEMSHIRNRDIQFMTLIAVLVGLAAILSHIILRWGLFSSRRGRDRDRGGGGIAVAILIIGIILAIFAPLVTRLVQFAVSRRREFLADASGAELTRYPEGLASALEKIMRLNQGKIDVSEAVSHLFISDPSHSGLDALYATHPPLEERIKRLRGM